VAVYETVKADRVLHVIEGQKELFVVPR
jgi:hypothetical protein